jgi:hypothetical protein
MEVAEPHTGILQLEGLWIQDKYSLIKQNLLSLTASGEGSTVPTPVEP